MFDEFIEKTFKKLYVINLQRRTDRYQEFNTKIVKYITPSLIERFDAINGKELNLNEFHESFIKTATNKGEVGCFLSHRTIWKNVSEDSTLKNDDLVLLFEDDVFFSTHFQVKFQEAIVEFQKIKKNNKFLYIGGRFKENFSPTIKELPHHWNKIQNSLYERFYASPTKSSIFDRTTHVNIFSKATAKKLYDLSLLDEPKPLAVDKFLIWCQWVSKEISFFDYFPHLCYSPINYKTDIQKK